MKKNVFGRQFKRDANERKALFKNLLTSLVLSERIKTTEAKAKSIRAAADKLVTKAKKGGDAAYKNLHGDVNQDAVVKLINDIAPRFATRNGGYTRIYRIHKRIADNAQMVAMEWTELNVKLKTQNEKEESEGTEKKAKKEAKPKKDVKKVEVKVKTEKAKKETKKK